MVMIVFLIILLLSLLLFVLSIWMRKRAGVPMGNVVYSDSQKMLGEILTAKNIPLRGKPDYLVKKGSQIIPVELKRGKTPQSPYPSHVAQLFAYCYLVKDNFNVRPDFGIVDYPDNDFKLEFPEGGEGEIEKLVGELLEKKKAPLSREGLHNLCRTCRQEHQK